jgi:hypothetical protein
MTYEEVMQRAFVDELKKLAEVHGGLPGFEKLAGIGGAANPFKGGPGLFQRFGQDLMAGGKMLGGQKLVAPGKFAPAGLGSRVAGEVAQSAGHHYAHKSTIGNLMNPLGGAMGGVAEGLTRSAGKELASAGAQVPGRAGRAMGAVGGGLQRAAKPMGMAGEVAGLAGLGTAVHAPLSVAGALGGKLVGAAAHAAPVVGEALHHVGHTVAHGVHDVVGTAAQSVADKARRAAGVVPKPVARPVTGYSMMPPPMAAGAH